MARPCDLTVIWTTTRSGSRAAGQRRQRRREEAEARGRLSPLRATVQKCEQQLEQLARERGLLEQQLAAPELYLPAARAKLQTALERQAELARLNAQAEADWLAASSALEQHSSSG
jgi:ATP-binding cassette subfamily F protein 3